MAGSQLTQWGLVVETKQKKLPERNVDASVSATKAVYKNQNKGTNQGTSVTILRSLCSWFPPLDTVIADFTATQRCDQIIFGPCFTPPEFSHPWTTLDRFLQAWLLSCLRRWSGPPCNCGPSSRRFDVLFHSFFYSYSRNYSTFTVIHSHKSIFSGGYIYIYVYMWISFFFLRCHGVQPTEAPSFEMSTEKWPTGSKASKVSPSPRMSMTTTSALSTPSSWRSSLRALAEVLSLLYLYPR